MAKAKKLNIKFLLILVGSVTAVFVLGIVIHQFQRNRNAGNLLTRALTAAEKEEYRDAVKLMAQYTQIKPQDNDGHASLARYWVEICKMPDPGVEDYRSAMSAFERALRFNPDDEKLRREAIDFYLSLGETQTAISHIRVILAKHPESPDPDLLSKLAVGLSRTGRFADAADQLAEAIGYDQEKKTFDKSRKFSKEQIDAFVMLAQLYRSQLEKPEDADRVIARVVEVLPGEFQAYLTRARYLLMFKGSEETAREQAKADITKAANLAPDAPEVLLNSYLLAVEEKDFEKAAAFLDAGIQKYPDNLTFYHQRFQLALRQDQPNEAMKFVKMGLEKIPNSPPLLQDRATLELMESDIKAARKTIDQLEKLRLSPLDIDYLNARLVMARENWIEAAERLEDVREKLPLDSPMQNQIDQQLAVCYARTGQPDLQLATARRLIQNAASSAEIANAHVNAARALSVLGRTDEAVQEYRTAVRDLMRVQPEALDAVLFSLLDLKITEQAYLEPQNRKWSQVDEIFAKIIERGNLGPADADLYRYQILALRGDDGYKQASELLDKTRQTYPDHPGIQFAHIDHVLREKGIEAATQEFEKAKAVLGDTVPVRLKEAQLLVLRGDENFRASLAKLEQDLDAFSDAEKNQLRRGLAGIHAQLRDYEQCRRLYQEVAESEPYDLQTLLTLFALAREEGNPEEVAEAAGAVKSLCGADNSTAQYVEATHQIWRFQNEQAGQEALSEARRLLDSAAKARPDWSAVSLLRSQIAFLEQDEESGLTWLLKAYEQGQLRGDQIGQLAQLLDQRGQPDKAAEVLRRQATSQRSDADRRLEVKLYLREGKTDQALELAQKIAPENSTNYGDHLWMAQIYELVGQTDRAEQALRRAIDLNGRSPDMWFSLVRLLAAVGKPVEAISAVRQAQLRLPENEVPLTLAQCYETLRQLEQAQNYYLTALSYRPDDPATLRKIASFYVNSNNYLYGLGYLNRMLKDAKPHEENVHPDVAWARRTKAKLICTTGSYQAYIEALNTIEENAPEGKPLSPPDLLTWIQISAARPEALSRQRAVQRLETMKRNGEKLPDSLLLILAQLYEGSGRWNDCQEIMNDLLTRNSQNPMVVEAWCRWLIEHDQAANVPIWLSKLPEDSPAAVRVGALFAAKQGNTQKAVDAIMGLIPDPLPPEQAGMLREVAVLFEQLSEYDPSLNDRAEELYRRYVEQEPRAKMILADFYGRHGKVDQALALCEESLAAETQPIIAITQLGGDTLRRAGKDATPAQIAKVKSWFERARREMPDSKALLLQSAELAGVEENHDEVIRLYKQYLDLKDTTPRQRAIVMNNLAFVQSLRGNTDSALEMINKAIDELGPSSDLLDTRAIVHLAMGNGEKAVIDMQQAMSGGKTPTKLFHLAQAQLAADDKTAATQSMQEALVEGLTAEQLTTLEQPKFHALLKQLGLKPKEEPKTP